MKIPVIVNIVLCLVSSQLLYPQAQDLPIQWINEGLWHQCQDQSQINAQNCYPNDDKFIECYLVPDEGLCTQGIQLTSNVLYASIRFNQTNKSSFALSINGKQYNQTYDVNGTGNTIVSFQNPNVPFKIKLTHTSGDKLFLTQLNIQSSMLSAYCQKQDNNNNCLSCDDPNFLYEGQCVSKGCLTQLSDLISNGISQRLSYQAGNLMQEFVINNIQVLGDCIVPRLYLIKNLEDPQMMYLLPKKYLTRPDNRSVHLTIPLDDLNQLPCDQLETSTDNVVQCYVSLAATVQDQTQFQYITVIRVSISKNTSSTVSYKDQGFLMPDQCCDSPSVDLLSEAKILNITKSGNQRFIIAKQFLRDPYYKNQVIQFQSASLINDQTYNLKLVNSTYDQSTMSITYYLLVDPLANISKSTTTLQINSNLALIGRFLESRAFNIKPNYLLMTIVNLYGNSDVKADTPVDVVSQFISNQNGKIKHKDVDLKGLYILLIVVIFLFAITVAYNTIKHYKKKYEREKQFYSTDQKIVTSLDQLE